MHRNPTLQHLHLFLSFFLSLSLSLFPDAQRRACPFLHSCKKRNCHEPPPTFRKTPFPRNLPTHPCTGTSKKTTVENADITHGSIDVSEAKTDSFFFFLFYSFLFFSWLPYCRYSSPPASKPLAHRPPFVSSSGRLFLWLVHIARCNHQHKNVKPTHSNPDLVSFRFYFILFYLFILFLVFSLRLLSFLPGPLLRPASRFFFVLVSIHHVLQSTSGPSSGPRQPEPKLLPRRKG